VALVGVGGVVVMQGLSSWEDPKLSNEAFCADSDHGGLGFHCSIKSAGSGGSDLLGSLGLVGTMVAYITEASLLTTEDEVA